MDVILKDILDEVLKKISEDVALEETAQAILTALSDASGGSSASVVKSIQQGTLTFKATTASAAINAVDPAKSVVLHGGCCSTDASSYSSSWDSRIALSADGTKVEGVIGVYNSSYTGPTNFTVLEFV